MKTTINLQDELIAENRKALAADQVVLAKQAALDAETDKLVNAALDRATADYETAKQKTLETLGFHYKLDEAKKVREKQSKWAHLPQERIFTKDAIKELCLKYNLRFLSTSYYKGALDSELPEKIEELRKANGGLLPGEKTPEAIDPNAQNLDGYFGADVNVDTVVSDQQQRAMATNMQAQVWANMQNLNVALGLNRTRMSSASFRWDHTIGFFSVAAPAESFALQPRPIDPLLFCNLGDDQYYLVHKWGNDVSWSRRWLKHWRLVVKEVLSVCTIAGLPVLGAQLRLLSPGTDTGDFLLTFGIVGGFALGFALVGLGEVFDFLTRNSKTTTSSNWDSPYTS